MLGVVLLGAPDERNAYYDYYRTESGGGRSRRHRERANGGSTVYGSGAQSAWVPEDQPAG